MAITKTIRFEVFKRDKFTCQYCGRSAPDVLLEVDHIQPVSSHGSDDMLNLITACKDCNRGKRDRVLSDDTAIKKKKAQLVELQERREQIEMISEWQRELMQLEDEAVDKVNEIFKTLVPGKTLNEDGKKDIKRLVKKYGLDEVITSLRISASQYLEIDEDRRLFESSIAKTIDYIEKIARSRQADKHKPYLKDLFYIRGIIRNRFDYKDERLAFKYLEIAYLLGIEIEDLKQTAFDCRNWSEWRYEMESMIEEAENKNT